MRKVKNTLLFSCLFMLTFANFAYSFGGPEFIGKKLQSNDLIKVTLAEIVNEGDILSPNYKLNFRIKILQDIELNKKYFKHYAISITEYNSEGKIINNRVASPLYPSEDKVLDIKKNTVINEVEVYTWNTNTSRWYRSNNLHDDTTYIELKLLD